MGFLDRPLFDFSGNEETDFMEWVEMQMTASSRQEGRREALKDTDLEPADYDDF